jgi:DNA-directed RNA polymerase specialized sigma24 family protein
VVSRVDAFDARGKGALEAYLRRGIENRIRDELRSLSRWPTTSLDGVDVADFAPSAVDTLISEEDQQRYRVALNRLREVERTLIVGALELGYTHEQLALITGRPTSDSARVALHRALRRLADEMTRV